MKREKGFTLIELLVVIAIIALLLSVIVPALKSAKQRAGSAVCLIHSKHLSLGWSMYHEDNDGRIMSSRMTMKDAWIREPYRNPACQFKQSDLKINQTDFPVEDEDEFRGIRDGRLWSYMETEDVYHCPSDKRKSAYDESRIFVSYVVPKQLNGWPEKQAKDAGNQYQVYKIHDLRAPSSKMVFVETGEERNWNWQGSFSFGFPKLMLAKRGIEESAWWGPVAMHHGDSSIFGFIDGHSEVRKWRDPFTKKHVFKLSQTGANDYDLTRTPTNQKEDVNWVSARYPLGATP